MQVKPICCEKAEHLAGLMKHLAGFQMTNY